MYTEKVLRAREHQTYLHLERGRFAEPMLLASTPSIAWRARVDRQPYRIAACDGVVVAVPVAGSMAAFDARDGSPLWSGETYMDVAVGIGPVVVGACQTSGVLSGLSSGTGEPVWANPLGVERLDEYLPPEDSTCVTEIVRLDATRAIATTFACSAMCIDATDGTVMWHQRPGRGGRALPALIKDGVVIWGDGYHWTWAASSETGELVELPPGASTQIGRWLSYDKGPAWAPLVLTYGKDHGRRPALVHRDGPTGVKWRIELEVGDSAPIAGAADYITWTRRSPTGGSETYEIVCGRSGDERP